MQKFFARLNTPKTIRPSSTSLHVGCGNRYYTNFTNIDVASGDHTVDLAAGSLPFPTNHFKLVVCNHVIEHLDLTTELPSLLAELHRVCAVGAQIYISTPNMHAICKAYTSNKTADLIIDRESRYPYPYSSFPPSQMLNHLFHQDGEHKNLFDLPLLAYCLQAAGFTEIAETTEEAMILKAGEQSRRNDSLYSLYVKCTK